MFNQRPEYPSPISKQLPSISSERSIHNVDKRKNKTIVPDKPIVSPLSPYIAEIQVNKH